MNGHWIYKICDLCGGTGSILEKKLVPEGNQNVTCPKCSGQKIYKWGFMTTDDYPLPVEIPPAP